MGLFLLRTGPGARVWNYLRFFVSHGSDSQSATFPNELISGPGISSRPHVQQTARTRTSGLIQDPVAVMTANVVGGLEERQGGGQVKSIWIKS